MVYFTPQTVNIRLRENAGKERDADRGGRREAGHRLCLEFSKGMWDEGTIRGA